jgi:hypothetical protein
VGSARMRVDDEASLHGPDVDDEPQEGRAPS